MADIGPILPGNSIVPPVPQDKAVEERDKKKRQEREKKQESDDENNNSDKDGIDYYA
jgi:hypothetical protein